MRAAIEINCQIAMEGPRSSRLNEASGEAINQ
jgi:hypothetical protein